MAELTLHSSRQGQLKPLVEAALHNELRLLEAGLNRTRQRLQEFETRFGLPSAEFIRRYEQGALEEVVLRPREAYTQKLIAAVPKIRQSGTVAI